MKKVGSKVAPEEQRFETPDDLSIPDFLRRTSPSTAAQRVEGRQQSVPSPSGN
jgi:hypothetical protein